MNAVFFDDVRVPVSHRVGAENDGWTVAKYLLEFERGGGNAGPGLEAAAKRLHRLASDQGVALPEGSLAALEVTIEAVKTLEFRILSALGQGQNGPESSMLKTLAGQARQQLSELTVSLMGPAALGGASAPAPRGAERGGRRSQCNGSRGGHGLEPCPLPGARTRYSGTLLPSACWAFRRSAPGGKPPYRRVEP